MSLIKYFKHNAFFSILMLIAGLIGYLVSLYLGYRETRTVTDYDVSAVLERRVSSSLCSAILKFFSNSWAYEWNVSL